MNSEEHVDLATLRLINESAIKAHALGCSAKYRAGKFTRVGSDFMDEVKADVEAMVREIRNKYATLHPPMITDGTVFVTGALKERVMAELDAAIGRLIQNKVQKQPTVGMTLSRTR